MQPTNKDEYLARFYANQGAEGWGLETASVIPCPFCAAPRWMVAKILEIEEAMQRSHHCGECGRSAKSILTHHHGGGKSFEVVQTGGPDQPDWFEPKMRRVDQ